MKSHVNKFILVILILYLFLLIAWTKQHATTKTIPKNVEATILNISNQNLGLG
ncbi:MULTISPECIES: hypothetical protein [Neobacillus]|uniref:Uncharacterized protein n=1 Tax=Neobacillus rhizophilus TaxID=2833579 RepID=A0A942U921_9BACI|nr:MULTISPECIES: hypothetical protein [Neobacillus]MBS4214817.1 hypothetical protein [Neobacillus rhizophilus]